MAHHNSRDKSIGYQFKAMPALIDTGGSGSNRSPALIFLHSLQDWQDSYVSFRHRTKPEANGNNVENAYCYFLSFGKLMPVYMWARSNLGDVDFKDHVLNFLPSNRENIEFFSDEICRLAEEGESVTSNLEARHQQLAAHKKRVLADCFDMARILAPK